MAGSSLSGKIRIAVRPRWRLAVLAALATLAALVATPAADYLPYGRSAGVADVSSTRWSAQQGAPQSFDDAVLRAPFVPSTTSQYANDHDAPPSGPVLSAADQWAHQGIVLLGSWEWDEVSLSRVAAALELLPGHIIPQLGNRDIGPLHIVVNKHGTMISGAAPYGGPANFFSTNDGLNEVVLYPRQSLSTVVHELGHAYNLRNVAPKHYAMVFLDPEMQSFMEATGWRVLSSEDQIRRTYDHRRIALEYEGDHVWPRMSHDDPLEDFANSFAMYFLDAEGLLAASPERYYWFETHLGR